MPKLGYKQTKEQKNKTRLIVRKRCNINRDSNYFNIINTELKAYLLGLLSADGNLYKTSISFGSKDKELINLFSKTFDTKIYDNEDIYRAKFKDINMSNRLKDLGFKERKSYNKGLDVLFNNIPIKLKRHFIRGFLDGDGSVSNEKSRFTVKFYNTDKRLLFCINKFLNPTKSFILNRPKKNQTVYELDILRKENFFKVYHLLYNKANYYLTRKKNKFLEVQKFEYCYGLKGIPKSKLHKKRLSLSRIKIDKGEEYGSTD